MNFKIEDFKINDRVFAKLPNCPYWPARINKLPDYISVPDGNYPIFFFGTHEVEFLPSKSLVPYAENKQKYIRNSRYQHFTEAIWEIENNFDILALDKDPAAENFLCEMHDTEKPTAKISDPSADSNAEKVIDVENPEINDVEGIMNLGENEWNEIFTIEEQEIHNNLSQLADPVFGNSVSDAANNTATPNGPVKTAIIREAISITPTKIKICQTSVPVSNENHEAQSSLHRSALHNNCKVIVEKLSIIQINRVIQSNFSVGLMEDLSKKNQKKPPSFVSSKPALIPTPANIDPKPKKAAISVNDSNPISTKPQIQPATTIAATAIAPDPRKPATSNKILSTINKNSVSRIIDAISIDSDDNQSCVIVSPPKIKSSSELKRKQEKIENELKILPTIKLKLVRPNPDTADKNDKLPITGVSGGTGATAAGNSDSRRSGKIKTKERKICKTDYMATSRNTNEKPLTFDNLFNKKFSILGSGLKIAKKAIADVVKEDPESSGVGAVTANQQQDTEENKPIKQNPFETEEDEGNFWPKMKECEDEFNTQPKHNGGYEETGGDFVDDDDAPWPVARTEEDMEPNRNCIKHEMKEGSNEKDVGTEEEEMSSKWYTNGTGAEEPRGESEIDPENADKKDPWSNYMAKKQKEDNLVGENVVELPDSDSEMFDVILKEEPGNPVKRSAGNVWSHIQEYQSQFDNGKQDVMDTMDGVEIGPDDAIRNMEYIQDAKWLNSTNEDFLDSPPLPQAMPDEENVSLCQNVDLASTIVHKKWYDRNRLPSPPNNVPSLMDIDTSRAMKEFRGPESWVDSGTAFGRAFRESSHNNRARNRHMSTNAKSRNNFVSPNSKTAAFQNIPFEQLFPPFKAEYFTNNGTKGNNNHQLSTPQPSEQQPGKAQNRAGKTQNLRPTDCRMPGNKLPGMMPSGDPYQYYGDPYHHYAHGMAMVEDPYYYYYYNNYYYGNNNHLLQQPSPMTSRAARPHSSAPVPITPESPDPYTDDAADPLTVGSKPSTIEPHKLIDPVAAASNKKPPPMSQMYYPQQFSYMTENGYYLPSEEEMFAYFYSCYNGHPPTAAAFGPMNPYHQPNVPARPYQPYSTANDPISYTPASPDPEEMCPANSNNP